MNIISWLTGVAHSCFASVLSSPLIGLTQLAQYFSLQRSYPSRLLFACSALHAERKSLHRSHVHVQVPMYPRTLREQGSLRLLALMRCCILLLLISIL